MKALIICFVSYWCITGVPVCDCDVTHHQATDTTERIKKIKKNEILHVTYVLVRSQNNILMLLYIENILTP